MDDHDERVRLFTLRFWLEDVGAGRQEWRGQLHQVGGGKDRYFRDWPQLRLLLQGWLTAGANSESDEQPAEQ